MDNLTVIHAHLFSYLIYSIFIKCVCHGEIGIFQFHIIIPISTSYNRKLRYYPTALRCG